SIIGGFSNGKKEILVLDALGSIIEDVYIAVGSSAELVTGVLESAYKEDLNIDESKELVKKAIKAALERDSSSGNGIDLLFITKDKTWEEFIPT
ncbi:MAG: proteasome subunit beta, partial [Thermoproteota archaeon]